MENEEKKFGTTVAPRFLFYNHENLNMQIESKNIILVKLKHK